MVGKIIFEAFFSIADKHGFPPDFPSVDTGRSLASSLLSDPRFYSIVAAGFLPQICLWTFISSGISNSLVLIGIILTTGCINISRHEIFMFKQK